MREGLIGLSIGLLITITVTGPLIVFDGPSGIESLVRPVVKQYYWNGIKFVPDEPPGKDLPQVRIRRVSPGKQICWSHYFIKPRSSATEPASFSWELTGKFGKPYYLGQEADRTLPLISNRTTPVGFSGEFNLCAAWPQRLATTETHFTIRASALYHTTHGWWKLHRYIKQSLPWDGKIGLAHLPR